MCGIVGYVGAKECTAILVNSLTKLEYRGYDSAGIAVFEGDRIKTVKAKGKLKDGLDAFDAIESLLPAGTLSGAPKIRACEIIEELERTPRGVYGGALGYVDFNGNLDTCIAIRMAVKKNNKVYVQAGAGIVADSVPESEYEETYNKALAVMNAVKNAGEVNAL